MIQYFNPDKFSYILNNIESNKTKELLTKVAEKNNYDYSTLFENYSFESESIMPIKKIMNILEMHELGVEGRRKETLQDAYSFYKYYYPSITYDDLIEIQKNKVIPENLKSKNEYVDNNLLNILDDSSEKRYKRTLKFDIQILQKFDSDITLDNIEERLNGEVFSNLVEIYKEFQEQKKEYNLYIESLNDYREIYNANENLKNTLLNHYKKLYYDLILDIMPDEIKEIYKNNKMTYKEENMFGTIKMDGLVDSFSTKDEELINSNSFFKDNIINNRIKYFKALGYDYGDNYESYLEHKEFWPDVNRIDKLKSDKEELLNKFNIEYFENTVNHMKNRDQINDLNLIDKNDGYNAMIYSKNSTCVIPNIRTFDNEVQLYPIVLISNDGYYSNNVDHSIVHELNHVFELSITNYDVKSVDYLCGWDGLREEIEKKQEVDTVNIDNSKREYELFNEIVNEKIAQEITSNLFKKDLNVFSNKDDSLKLTGYQATNFIVDNFYEHFKDDIIKSRKNNNINVIFDKVGKENFDKLNSLFYEFNDNFSGLKIYSVIDDLKSGKTNEKTELYKSIQSRSKEIFNNMVEYDNKKVSTSISK